MNFNQALSQAFDGCHVHFVPSTVETLRELFDLGRDEGRIERTPVEEKVVRFEDLRVGDVISNRWLHRHGQRRQVTELAGPGIVFTRFLGNDGEILINRSSLTRDRFETHAPYWYRSP